MLYVYVICICYMYMLYVYVICICYMYMLYVYVICICYMYMLQVYGTCICFLSFGKFFNYNYPIIERNVHKTLIYSCDLFLLMLLLQFETIFLAWFLPFSLINLIVVFSDGSSIFVTVIFLIVIRVTVII
jgi:hypothetical protein